MNDLNSAISILNLLGLGGLGVFIYYIVKGLRERITSLTQLAEDQAKTLDAVRVRATEYEYLSAWYKKVLLDCEEMYKILDERKNKLVAELKEDSKRKDNELANLRQSQLREIEIKQQSLDKIPKLEKNLQSVLIDFKEQLQILSRATASFGDQTNALFSSFELPVATRIEDSAIIGIDHPLIINWIQNRLRMMYISK